MTGATVASERDPIRVHIVTPASAGSRLGNRVGAERWATMLGELGHEVTLGMDADEEATDADLLIALHARRSGRAIRAFAKRRPGRPIVVVLTGTDLYRDLTNVATRGAVEASLDAASVIVALQTDALEVIPERWRPKTRVILQSAVPPARVAEPRARTFDVCVVGHLRPIKDPLRPALASRKLPAASRIAVLHAGRVLHRPLLARVEREQEQNPRYRYLGSLTHHKTLQLIARSRLLVVPSKAEGGAHVVSEALVVGTPIIGSRISGNIGMLGVDYPGLYPVGDTAALAELMWRVEREAAFRARLELWCSLLAPGFIPERERFALRTLIADLTPAP